MNKKAISPLISTIVMLGFAITLGFVVMGWGGEIKGQEAYSDCNKANVDLVIINNEQVLCYGDEGLSFMLENTGSIDVKALKLNIIGDQDISRVEIEQSIRIGDVVKMITPYDKENIGSIQLLKFFGMVNEDYCGDSLLEIDEIDECE
tara:strand:+ start:1301 stop:1744 length:444 start_codon:yes stop_codon:yes gene_type:complete